MDQALIPISTIQKFPAQVIYSILEGWREPLQTFLLSQYISFLALELCTNMHGVLENRYPYQLLHFANICILWIRSDLNNDGLNNYFINWINNLCKFRISKIEYIDGDVAGIMLILPRQNIRLQTLHIGSSSATLISYL